MSTIKSSAENLTLNADGSNNDVIIQSNGSTVVTVDGSATSVGINETVPLGTLHIKSADSGASVVGEGDELVVEGSGHAGISILSGTSSEGAIYFGDSGDNDIGRVLYRHSDNEMRLVTNNAIAMKIDSTGAVTKPLQPAFLVKVTSQVNNLAINTTHSIAFGTEIFDQNADFGSNTFTAPVTGRYQLNALLYLKQLDKDTAYNELFIVTSNRTYTNIIAAPAFNADASYWTLALSVLADMDASDTSTIGFSIPNSGSAQIDLAADSYFSGYLVC